MRQFIKKTIRLLGGFATVDEAIDSIQSEEEKHKILTRAVAKLYNTIDEDDVLKKDSKGQYTFKDKPLMPEQMESLRIQAKSLLSSFLFKVLDGELHYRASHKMFYEAKSVRDIIDAKQIEYVWDIIKNRLNKL